MSNCSSRIAHATIVLGVEEPEHLLCRSRQNLSSNRPAGRFRIDVQERAYLPTGDEPERNVSFPVFVDQILSEELLENINTAP